jgi:AcrR family transcriptional regulator
MERTRAAILGAARKNFLQSGYSDASMDGIADAAGVSVKTIYGHFKNKKELFSAVMQAGAWRKVRREGLRMTLQYPHSSLGSQMAHNVGR